MAEWPTPELRTSGEIELAGRMSVYRSQAEASEGIPRQWRAFRRAFPWLKDRSLFYGASPCTADHKIHYLAGVANASAEDLPGCERLMLAAGEYAVVRVEDPGRLRETWVWMLSQWLPTSGRRERNAPEFERFTSVSEEGTPVGAVEIWVPIEDLENRLY